MKQVTESNMRNLINPREIWENETEDFSPWLARNLDLLDQILYTELRIVSLEQPVGRFNADMFCVNANDDSLVIIENQLEITDHAHLGKLLTYAVGLQARYIIWIATEFENEHRNVLEWLNDNTSPGLQFFGVKLELIRIDSSDCRPKLSLMVEPRNRIRPQVNYSPPVNDSVDSRSQFWSKFRQHIDNFGTVLKPADWDPNKPDYLGFDLGFDIGQTDIWLAAWRHTRGTQIAVNLHMKQRYVESHFDKLNERRVEIEQDFGAEPALEWSREPYHLRDLVRQNPDYNIPQVGVYDRRVDLKYEDSWTDYFEWMVSNLEKLYRVFRPRIEQIL